MIFSLPKDQKKRSVIRKWFEHYCFIPRKRSCYLLLPLVFTYGLSLYFFSTVSFFCLAAFPLRAIPRRGNLLTCIFPPLFTYGHVIVLSFQQAWRYSSLGTDSFLWKLCRGFPVLSMGLYKQSATICSQYSIYHIFQKCYL